VNNSKLTFNAYFNKFKHKPEYMGSVLIIAIILLNILMEGREFFSSSGMQTLFSTALPLVILTMAQVIVLISGNIDLSTGITMSFVNVFAVMMPVHLHWLPIWAAYCIAFALAVLIGYINGALIGYFRIPPMLATFGMAFIINGVNLLISDRPQGKVPRNLWKIYQGNVYGIPNSLFLLIILILVWFYLKKRAAIKEIYALGGDEKATYLTGISTAKTTIRAFILSGVFVGIAGLAWTLMLASSNPISGDIKTLQSIAAALIGGVLISGGWGTMICGILGAFFMVLVNNTTGYMFTRFIPSIIPGFSVSTYYQDFTGQLITMLGIIFAISISSRAKRIVYNVLRVDSKKESEIK
jgi:ribose/xylose/arabinose/galactoside ABC-type transport system permease subunit